jgi:hypothetical protein
MKYNGFDYDSWLLKSADNKLSRTCDQHFAPRLQARAIQPRDKLEEEAQLAVIAHTR